MKKINIEVSKIFMEICMEIYINTRIIIIFMLFISNEDNRS